MITTRIENLYIFAPESFGFLCDIFKISFQDLISSGLKCKSGRGLEVFSVYSTAGSPHGLTRYVGPAKYTRESDAGIQILEIQAEKYK